MDGLMAWLLFKATNRVPEWTMISVMIGFAIWLVFAKVVKLVPHFTRYPMDIRFIPVAIVFGYLHGFIKISALLTLNAVSRRVETIRGLLMLDRQIGEDVVKSTPSSDRISWKGPSSR